MVAAVAEEALGEEHQEEVPEEDEEEGSGQHEAEEAPEVAAAAEVVASRGEDPEEDLVAVSEDVVRCPCLAILSSYGVGGKTEVFHYGLSAGISYAHLKILCPRLNIEAVN